jgi:hypothetical protein
MQLEAEVERLRKVEEEHYALKQRNADEIQRCDMLSIVRIPAFWRILTKLGSTTDGVENERDFRRKF